ncbi:MAG: radical SAM protein [Candidatus Bathyarchaeia archaeon]
MAIAVHLLGECPCDCKFCYARNIHGFLDLRAFEEICKIFCKNDSRMILTGGEPLLRKDLKTLIRMAIDYGFYVSVSTSGSVWNEDIFEADSVQISLDYCSEKHDKSRAMPGLYKKCLELASECERRGVIWWFRANLLDDNLSDIIYMATRFPLWINRVKGMPIDKRLIDIIYGISLNMENVFIADPPFYALTKSALAREQSSCAAGLSYFSITPSGSITPCHFIKDVIGELHKTNYEELTNAGRKWRAQFTLGDDVCKKCKLFDFCGGGCFANMLYSNKKRIGDAIFDELCPLRFTNEEIRISDLRSKLDKAWLANFRKWISENGLGC